MGGNALKNCKLRRRNRQEYKALESEVINKLSDLFSTFRIPRYFDDKADFGDIDILYLPNEQFSVDEVAKRLESNEYVRNGLIVSFEYRNFQVDLIRTGLSEMEISYVYFSWSNFGKLIGIICAYHDLSFGNSGLWYNMMFDDADQRKILLSQDPVMIFNFLGLDYDAFKIGFKNELDMFQYVSGCKLYHRSIFLDEGNNTFPKKRSETFGKFANAIPDNGLPEPSVDFMDVLNYFSKVDEYISTLNEYNRNKTIKQRFNGRIVGEITGLTDRKLGDFMKHLRSINNFIDFILNNDPEAIKKRISDEFIYLHKDI
jgi:hypothetical protein